MKTVYLNASYFPAVELLSAIGTAAILLLRRLPGHRRSASSSACWSPSSATCRPSSTRSSRSASSTRPISRGWRRSTRSSTCSTPRPDIVDGPNAIDPGEIKGEIDLEGVWFAYAREPGPGDGLGADRHRPADPARPDRRPRRRDRRRQVDPGEAGRALLRPAARADPDRRASTSASSTRTRCAAASGSFPRRVSCSAARSPTTSRSAAPMRRRRTSSRPLRTVGGRAARSTASPRASTPRSASAGHRCRPASARSSPSPGRCWPSRGS